MIMPEKNSIYTQQEILNRYLVSRPDREVYIYTDPEKPYEPLFGRFAMMAGFQSFREYIRTQVNKPDSAVLDIGYGKGDFLAYIKHFNPQATLTGIDSKPLRPSIDGVRTIIDNLNTLPQHIPANSQDVITAANIAMWVPDPLKDLIVQPYSLLKPQHGVLFINGFPYKEVFPDPNDQDAFIDAIWRLGWKYIENEDESNQIDYGIDLLIPASHPSPPLNVRPSGYFVKDPFLTLVQYTFN